MPYLILAVLLAVMQAVPPAPRQAPDNSAGSGDDIKKNAQSDKKPAAQPKSIVEAVSPKPHEQRGNTIASDNAQQPIRIRELPPVSVRRDWMDCLSLIFGGILVVVGSLGVWAALGTLRAIKRQADLMEGGLYVDTPRVIDFEDGKEPIVFVKIMNSGMIAARNVSFSIQIELGNHASHTSYYVQDQIITIPAHAGRECFLRHGKVLEKGELLKVQRGELVLRISGHAAKQKEKIEYCFKYNPWPFENRPKDLPEFVPCDFDTRTALSAIVRPTGFSLKVEAGEVTARGESSDTKASPEPSEPE